MAINPALVKAAVQALSTEDGCKVVLISILGPVFLLLLIICLFAYILSAPFQ